MGKYRTSEDWSNQMIGMTIRLTNAEKLELEEVASEMGMAQSDLIRKAIKQFRRIEQLKKEMKAEWRD